MDFPTLDRPIPWLSTEQMIEVDRLMIEVFRIELIQMMENAGRGLARVAKDRFFGGHPNGRRVVALAGPGGNGGGALVAARRLHTWGAHVEVVLSAPADAFTPVPAHQLDIVQQLGIPVHAADALAGLTTPELVLDGVIGYSLHGNPRDGAALAIRWAMASGSPILALDAPSGLDTTTGTVHPPAMRANATVTLALPKRGLGGDIARQHVGELYLADISVPPELYATSTLGLEVPVLFAESDVIHVPWPTA